jgi:ribosomal protein L37AE/L43A
MQPHLRDKAKTSGRLSSSVGVAAPRSKATRGPATFTIARTVSQMRQAHCCAQCHEPIVLPEWSEWLDAGSIRHVWQCDACGYTFETMVHFAAA